MESDIVRIIIDLACGVIGGNAAGLAMPDKSLGVLGNSITGIIGGGVSGFVLKSMGFLGQAAQAGAQAGAEANTLDLTTLLAHIGIGGIGGALLMLIIGFVKHSMKSA